jgi:hypothetical protein
MMNFCCGNDEHVYINSLYKKGEIIVKSFSCDPYSKEFDTKELAGNYLVFREDGEISHYNFKDSSGYKTMSPGFFKLNRNLMKELLNK